MERRATEAEVLSSVYLGFEKDTGYSDFPKVEDTQVYFDEDRAASLNQKDWSDLHQFCVSTFYPIAKRRWVEKFGLCRPVLRPVWTIDKVLGDQMVSVDVYRYASIADMELLENYRPHPKASEYSMPSPLHSFGFGDEFDFASLVHSCLDDVMQDQYVTQGFNVLYSLLGAVLEAKLLLAGFPTLNWTISPNTDWREMTETQGVKAVSPTST